jgi:hypothetical protein
MDQWHTCRPVGYKLEYLIEWDVATLLYDGQE